MTSTIGETATITSRSGGFRERTQILGAVLLSVVLPFFARFGTNAAVHAFDQTGTSLLVLLAIIGSHVFLKKFSRYPSQDPLSTVLPAVTVCFAIVVMLITFGHLDYSRSLLFMGYFMTLVWYGGLAFLRARMLKPRLTVVPVGTGRNLPLLAQAEWRVLREPPATVLPQSMDGVVVDLTAELDQRWEDFLVNCAAQGVPIYDSTRTREFMTGEVDLRRAGDIGMDALQPHRSYMYFKSVIAIAGAVITLPVTLALLGFTCLLIKLDSPGPAFFVQKRMGQHGRIFDCYKLRSMHIDSDKTGPGFTMNDDPRVTRVGRVIRKYRLDELPQVFNILKGEMSWIGPRPEALALALDYGQHIPYYAFRHSVKPGISGWAAIRQGNVAEVTEATRKLRHDFFYIKNMSASLDAFIAVKTMWIVITGFGSR